MGVFRVLVSHKMNNLALYEECFFKHNKGELKLKGWLLPVFFHYMNQGVIQSKRSVRTSLGIRVFHCKVTYFQTSSLQLSSLREYK